MLDRPGHRLDDRNDALLASLAEDGDRIDAFDGSILPGEAEGLRNAQARAVEQSQNRRIAGEHPGRPVVPALVGLRESDGIGGRERTGKRSGEAGRTHGAEGRAFSMPLAGEVAREGTQGGELAHQGAAFHPFAPARRHEGADIPRRQADDLTDAWRLPEMNGQEDEELPEVAGIGLDGLGGEPPLPGENPEPGRRFPAGIRSAGDEAIDGNGLA